jgi:hypothetical protein
MIAAIQDRQSPPLLAQVPPKSTSRADGPWKNINDLPASFERRVATHANRHDDSPGVLDRL